ncbi:hypothetical protein J5N97_012064 [Dioscorea zingiberensis]|uniref:non-specific serine/threonine protein kinase n=1 Tax=Dioscorea zingiberensis TaxID=325984 RepID=A0A9D5HHD4_9LILI|nr:hypothetical protein J5N97_012064 [Dioscorea zingiberensis]
MIYGRRDETQTLLTFIKVRAGDPGGATTTTPPPLNLIKKEVSGVPLVVFLSAIAGLIVFFIVLFIIMFKSKVVRYRMIRSSIELAGFMDEMAPRSFSYHELHEATEGFKEELGRGAFGTVFKGTLPSTGRSVAVKRLEKVVEEGEREFQTEMKVIGRAHHRNLVTLLGFCNEGSNRLLVYEFMSNGSLADLIFRAEQNRPDWKERKNMELEVEVEEIILSEWVYSCYLVGELKKLILDEDNVDMVEFENMVKRFRDLARGKLVCFVAATFKISPTTKVVWSMFQPYWFTKIVEIALDEKPNVVVFVAEDNELFEEAEIVVEEEVVISWQRWPEGWQRGPEKGVVAFEVASGLRDYS